MDFKKWLRKIKFNRNDRSRKIFCILLLLVMIPLFSFTFSISFSSADVTDLSKALYKWDISENDDNSIIAYYIPKSDTPNEEGYIEGSVVIKNYGDYNNKTLEMSATLGYDNEVVFLYGLDGNNLRIETAEDASYFLDDTAEHYRNSKNDKVQKSYPWYSLTPWSVLNNATNYKVTEFVVADKTYINTKSLFGNLDKLKTVVIDENYYCDDNDYFTCDFHFAFDGLDGTKVIFDKDIKITSFDVESMSPLTYDFSNVNLIYDISGRAYWNYGIKSVIMSLGCGATIYPPKDIVWNGADKQQRLLAINEHDTGIYMFEVYDENDELLGYTFEILSQKDKFNGKDFKYLKIAYPSIYNIFQIKYMLDEYPVLEEILFDIDGSGVYLYKLLMYEVADIAFSDEIIQNDFAYDYKLYNYTKILNRDYLPFKLNKEYAEINANLLCYIHYFMSSDYKYNLIQEFNMMKDGTNDEYIDSVCHFVEAFNSDDNTIIYFRLLDYLWEKMEEEGYDNGLDLTIPRDLTNPDDQYAKINKYVNEFLLNTFAPQIKVEGTNEKEIELNYLDEIVLNVKDYFGNAVGSLKSIKYFIVNALTDKVTNATYEPMILEPELDDDTIFECLDPEIANFEVKETENYYIFHADVKNKDNGTTLKYMFPYLYDDYPANIDAYYLSSNDFSLNYEYWINGWDVDYYNVIINADDSEILQTFNIDDYLDDEEALLSKMHPINLSFAEVFINRDDDERTNMYLAIPKKFKCVSTSLYEKSNYLFESTSKQYVLTRGDYRDISTLEKYKEVYIEPTNADYGSDMIETNSYYIFKNPKDVVMFYDSWFNDDLNNIITMADLYYITNYELKHGNTELPTRCEDTSDRLQILSDLELEDFDSDGKVERLIDNEVLRKSTYYVTEYGYSYNSSRNESVEINFGCLALYAQDDDFVPGVKGFVVIPKQVTTMNNEVIVENPTSYVADKIGDNTLGVIGNAFSKLLNKSYMADFYKNINNTIKIKVNKISLGDGTSINNNVKIEVSPDLVPKNSYTKEEILELFNDNKIVLSFRNNKNVCYRLKLDKDFEITEVVDGIKVKIVGLDNCDGSFLYQIGTTKDPEPTPPERDPDPTPTPPGGGGGSTSSGPIYIVVQEDLKNTHKAYMNGYNDTTFRPNDNITREEVATIVARLDTEFNEDYNFTSYNDFNDSENRWSKNYLGFCKMKELIRGYEDCSYHPTRNMTRGELASLVSNFQRFKDLEAEDKNTFKDVDGRWYEEAVNKLAHLGILNGYEDGTFRGDQPVTRIEVAIVMNKINGRTISGEVPEEYSKKVTSMFKDISPNRWFFKDVVEATINHPKDLF